MKPRRLRVTVAVSDKDLDSLEDVLFCTPIAEGDRRKSKALWLRLSKAFDEAKVE